MKSKKVKTPEKEWLLTLYSEIWNQYIHEDQVAQTRGTIFTALLTALLAALGVLSPFVLSAPCVSINNYRIYLGLVLLGALWILVVIFMRSLTNSFERVTLAGRGYVNVRGASLRLIEQIAGLDMLGPALFEDQWRKKSNEFKNVVDVKVLNDFPGEEYTTIPRYNFAGGFVFFREVIKTLRKVYMFLQLAGVLLILIGSTGTFINLHAYLGLSCP